VQVLAALAKARPGQLNYASGGVDQGSTSLARSQKGRHRRGRRARR
jgi:hypothetical protein